MDNERILNEYIAQCESADEIQNGYIPRSGDYAVRACEYGHYNIGLVSWGWVGGHSDLQWMLLDGSDGITLNEGSKSYYQKLIWLPTQSQLQKLVQDDNHMHLLAYDFAIRFHGTKDPFYADIPYLIGCVDEDNSMEQMWLAYVMYKLYGKKWLNGSWVKKGD